MTKKNTRDHDPDAPTRAEQEVAQEGAPVDPPDSPTHHHDPDHVADPAAARRAEYDAAIDAVAAGAKRLTDAGVGGSQAQALAFEIWKCCGGR